MADQIIQIGAYQQRMVPTTNGVGGLEVPVQLHVADAAGNTNPHQSDLQATGHAYQFGVFPTFSELSQAAPALAATMDFPLVAMGASRHQSLALAVTTGFAWVTAGQPTLQLYCGRTASSVSDANHPLRGVAVALGPLNTGATALAVGTYVFTAEELSDLHFYLPYLGVRLVFPSTPSAGAATAYFDYITD